MSYPLRIFTTLLRLTALFLVVTFTSTSAQNKEDVISSLDGAYWRSGVARVNITPEIDMWMSGYAARDKPSNGKLHDLWVKALALEDEHGKRAVFITSDLIGLSRDISKDICLQIMKNQGLERSDIVLSSSHTHSGPVVNSNLHLIYPEFDPNQLKQIASYKMSLKKAIVQCVDNAFVDMEAAIITSGIGIARFAVNRRNNKPEEILHSSQLKGPYDHSVPVLSIRSPDGSLKTILFGYACHCTTLDLNKWNGDYAGYAQIDLEKKYPGCTAMFYAACAGDQNPEPRRLVPQAEQYGLELSAAVATVLVGSMDTLPPDLKTKYHEIELDFAKPPSIAELDSVIKNDPEWQKRWAKHYQEKMKRGEYLAKSYPAYPVQTLKLGDLTMLALGGEVVVDYAIRIKNIWGNEVFIAAYSNDVMAYIPSERVLEEGGYEGKTSMRAYGQPATWAPGIEDKIILEVDRQLISLGKKR